MYYKFSAFILFGLMTMSVLGCKSKKVNFPATNEEKAKYLEKDKESSHQPTNDADRYDKESGKGGGIHPGGG